MAEPGSKVKRRQTPAWIEDDLKKALQAYKDGVYGLNECARVYGISKPTLRRHLMNKNKFARDGVKVRGRSTNLPPQVEEDLVKHILLLEGMMFGITRKYLMQLAFQLAEANNLQHNFNKRKKTAGKDWFNSFMKRHPTLSLRQSEPSSIARASGFNRSALNAFYNNLESIIDKHSLQAKDIFNMDETNLSTTPKTKHKIIAAKGKRQVGSLSSAEKGVTGVFCMSAAGYFLPPMVIFKRKRMKDELKDGAPPGTLFACNDSGCMDSELFEKWMDHFITLVKPSKETPVLLILDGHATHTKNLSTIRKSSESGVIMLSLPPHTAHHMQPLDIAVFKPLQTYYEQEVENWLQLNPGRGITTFQVCTLMGHAFAKIASMCNAISGFRKPGIWPFNRNAFGDHEFTALTINDHNAITIPCSHGIASPFDHETSRPCQSKTSSFNQLEALAPFQNETSPAIKSEISVAESSTLIPTQKFETIKTTPDGRCFFRSISISLNPSLQQVERDDNGKIMEFHKRIQEKALADSLRAQVMNYMCNHLSDYEKLDQETLSADMPPHKRYKNILERVEDMFDTTTMPGELEVIATSKVIERPIIIVHNTNSAVLEYGMNEFSSSSPVVLMFTRLEEDVGHYECLLVQQHTSHQYQ